MSEEKQCLTSHWRVKIDKKNKTKEPRPAPPPNGFNLVEMQMRWKIDKRKRKLVANPLPQTLSAASNSPSSPSLNQTPCEATSSGEPPTKRMKYSSEAISAQPLTKRNSKEFNPIKSTISMPPTMDFGEREMEEDGSSLSSPTCSSPIQMSTEMKSPELNVGSCNSFANILSPLPSFHALDPVPAPASVSPPVPFPLPSNYKVFSKTPLSTLEISRNLTNRSKQQTNSRLPAYKTSKLLFSAFEKPPLSANPSANTSSSPSLTPSILPSPSSFVPVDREINQLVSKFFIFPKVNGNPSLQHLSAIISTQE